MLEGVIENGFDMGIGKRVENGLPLTAGFHKSSLLEDTQLMGNGRDSHVKLLGDVTNTKLLTEQGMQDTNAGRVAEELEKFRNIREDFLCRQRSHHPVDLILMVHALSANMVVFHL